MEATINTSWLLVCALLVFSMQAGFCCIESGLCRSKNSINVAIKNVVDLCISCLLFWICGYAMMSGTSFHGLVGTDGFVFSDPSDTHWVTVLFLFQMAFCGTATTIASGVVAERMRFVSYMVLAALISGLVYPVFGHWAWGESSTGQPSGWLARIGFVDFAGSTVVHSVGAWCALATALLIGPRLGRFSAGRSARHFTGHNLPNVALGMFILWIGWFGFNGGSTRAFTTDVVPILINTFFAGASGGLSALAIQRLKSPVIAVEPVINGVLSGLVAITASCHAVSLGSAVLIGAVAAAFLHAGMYLLERVLYVDDVVNAVPVHGCAGTWGTLAFALFAPLEAFPNGHSRLVQLGIQATGVVVCFLWCIGCTFLVMRIAGRCLRLRVSPAEESVGLNVAEHGATTESFDLMRTMELNADGRSDLRAAVDPFSDLGLIARKYNEVLDAHFQSQLALEREQFELRAARKELEERNHDLSEALTNLRHAQCELVQADKLAAVGQLAAGIAHEINTPIQFIGDNTQACSDMFDDLKNVLNEYRRLLQALERDERFAETVERIRQFEEQHDVEYIFDDAPNAFGQVLEGIHRVREIVQAMKRFSHSGKSGERTHIDLNRALSDTLTVAHSELKHVADVDVDFCEIPRVPCFAGEINQVFLNLLINAAHAIQDSGRNQRGMIRVRSWLDGSDVVVSIDDNGCGIPLAARKRIFDPFFTTKEVGRGSGQGLAIARSIVVDAHGGSIDCDSEPGVGTTFYVRLPLEPDRAEQELISMP